MYIFSIFQSKYFETVFYTKGVESTSSYDGNYSGEVIPQRASTLTSKLNKKKLSSLVMPRESEFYLHL